MNSKHRKTLDAVFTQPASATLRWSDLEALLVGVGCEVTEGKGSHVQFARDGVRLGSVRPHPGKEAKRYQVRDVRDFLIQIGVTA